MESMQDDGKPAVLRKILIEFLYTKNQAGEPWSPPTPTPYESYYNHYQYINGWSYHGTGLGTPFIGTRADIREELPSSPNEYFINNRVAAAHIGCEGSLASLSYVLKASYSWNYGTYRTTDEEQSTNIDNPGVYGIFGVQRQFSTYFQLGKELKNGFNLSCITALDTGELYYNSFGLFLSISKSL
jgi:hypothetical protein